MRKIKDKHYVVRNSKEEISKIFGDNNPKRIAMSMAITLGIFAICTGICFLLDYFKINDLNFIIIYVLGILISAVFTSGFIYSSLLSIFSVFGYNFLFTVPRYTFHFDNKMYLVTFVLMFAVSIIVSAICYQLKNRLSWIIKLNIEKEQLKSEAEKEQLKATLLRSISHDLRTPLTTIKNGAEVLQSAKKLEKTESDEILSDIVSKADWTIRLVENLLSLTRIDSNKLSVKKSAEALEEVIPQAVRNVSGKIKNRRIKYDMPKDLLLVPMDATLIIQVIGNILDNAIKHTKKDGIIWIKVWNSGKNVIFRIYNNGDPINEEDLPFIFDMYYTSGDGKHDGVGLGLSICKLIIKAHGGEITARNAEGRVVFEFTLPLEDENG